MARRGGYGKDVEGIEWAKLGAAADAQGKLSAASVGQSYYTWLNDAVAFHVHYCERYQLHQLYRQDQQDATARNAPTVMPHDPKYQPRSPRPSMTFTPAPGQGSDPARNFRPTR